jgi:hypothetical protein
MFDIYVLQQLADEQIQARLEEAEQERLVREAELGHRARSGNVPSSARPWWGYPAAGKGRARPEGTAS